MTGFTTKAAISLGGLLVGAAVAGCGSVAHSSAPVAQPAPSSRAADGTSGTFVDVYQYGGTPGSHQGLQPGRMVYLRTSDGRIFYTRTGANGMARFSSVGRRQTQKIWVDVTTCSDGVWTAGSPLSNVYTVRCDVK